MLDDDEFELDIDRMLVRGNQMRCPVPLPHFPGLWHDKSETERTRRMLPRVRPAAPPRRRRHTTRLQDDGRYFANVRIDSDESSAGSVAGSGISGGDASTAYAEERLEPSTGLPLAFH